MKKKGVEMNKRETKMSADSEWVGADSDRARLRDVVERKRQLKYKKTLK